MKEAFDLIKERFESEIESSDKYIREYDSSQVQIAWNKGMRKCLEIVSEVEAEYGKKGCALCYLGSPCEYQNEDVRIPDELMGWIPCSERLPEEATVYEVTEEIIICSQKQYIVEHRLFGTEGEWLCPSNRKVIAWRPLPSPYKPTTD